ncbi:MAG TPA: IgGFc-binding protein [Polyangiaceae bacterium]|nr:IgGFc-binding protein [Polyangiaceae bacterium]
MRARGLRLPSVAFVTLAGIAMFSACGSRTGLLVPPEEDAGPLYDGGPLDVAIDCSTPRYCVPSDPGYVYECGVRVFQCSSLEQCEERESGAQCVNPCLDTLGNDTSNGCEFYAVEMDLTPEAMGVCYAVFVVNQWPTGEPAKIQVDRDGQVLPIADFARIPVGKGTQTQYAPFDAAHGLPENGVAVLFLSRDPAALNDPNASDPRVLAGCPDGVTPAVQGDASLHGSGTASAFHIKTNVPVVAYQMLPFGGGRARVTGSTLLLPTSAWASSYVVADAYQAPTMFTEDRAGPTTVIVGSSDGTHVTLTPTADVVGGGGLRGTPMGVPVTYTVNRGQYLQLTQPVELTGSSVHADAPIAVIGGNTLMDLPLDRARADSAEQMLPPVRALGSEYVAVRYRSRLSTGEEIVPWRIVGAADGTVLTYEPSAPPGAPTTLAAQQLVEFQSAGLFVVRSQDAQHPFYLASYMTGGGDNDGIGDPEFVNVVPPAQYLPRYTFFTDPTYPETNLVLVRVRDPGTGQFPDVNLDCAGVIGGWLPIGTSGTYQFARVDLSTGNFQGVAGCDNGVHVIRGPSLGARFGVTVWGWGNNVTWPPDSDSADETNPRFTRWVSYGYPAGANFAVLNTLE